MDAQDQLILRIREACEDTIRAEILKLIQSLEPLIRAEIERIAPLAVSPVLNRKDAAAYCGCSATKLDGLRKIGKLHGDFLGEQPRYRKTELDKLSREHTAKARRKKIAASAPQ